MAAWTVSWRIVLTRGRDWPGPATEVLTADSVDELRQVVMRARRDPAIVSYRYWRHRDWDGPQRRVAPCGDEYVPAGISRVPCRCGDWHGIFTCFRCGVREVDPPVEPGCGPIPTDPSAPAGRGP